ncbi:MAG: putative LPS assembly protein LptD [Bacteroidales bacterium]|nr:putative LPS assembly protein LptD [Bacteroidales bacterium]
MPNNKITLLLFILFVSLFREAEGHAFVIDTLKMGINKAVVLPVETPPLLPKDAVKDSLVPKPLQVDSLGKKSASADSSILALKKDSVATPAKKKNALDADVRFTSADSVIFTADGVALMYTSSAVKYKDKTLTSDLLRMNMDSSVVNAFSRKDSAGNWAQLPKFNDNGTDYESQNIRYNFKTSKGIITNVVTQQGEGYVSGYRTKKLNNNDLCMIDGKYTTCDNHEHPHFYFNLTKAKVRPKKWIVTGPAYLVFADVPLPLVLPFGFFPFSESYSSGIIVPTIADEMNRGFGLREGGYYFAISDYMDLALTGEVYTKGSWGINAASRYRRKYKYSGSFNLSRIVTINGEKNMPDYSEATDFRIAWNHMQDAKANPYRTLSASVNFSTSSYDRNNLNSYYDPNRFTSNTKSSSINVTQRFATVPLALSMSSSLSQRSQDKSVSLTLPDFTVTASSIYPFKRKNAAGSDKWYEKIRMSYSGYVRNSISTKENLLFKSSLIKDWRNGAQHNIPVSATFNLFKYINITPSVAYTERWYSSKLDKSWDAAARKEVIDTVWGFNRVFNYSAAISASTKLYGFYKPLSFLGGKRVEAIRHMFTPTVSLSATPDFGAHRFGYWDSYSYTDDKGNERIVNYNHYSNGLFGAPGQGKSGNINMSFANNVEMKLRPSAKDTSNIGKKISLIDNFTMGVSYNMAADSLNWSDINASIRLKLTKGFTLNLSGLFETYTYGLDQNGNPRKVNVTEMKKNHIPGRLASTGTSFSYSISNETFKKKEKKEVSTEKKEDVKLEDLVDEEGSALSEEELANRKQLKATEEKKKAKQVVDPDGYVPFSFPWNVGFSYSMRYGKADFNKSKMRYNMAITHSLGLSATITPAPKWHLSASGNFDFETKKLAYMTCSVSRDLHCWNLSGSFVPVGPYKSYFFTIAVNASMLKDVKYEQRSNFSDNVRWY